MSEPDDKNKGGDNELVKYKEMAERYKRQRDEFKEQLDSLTSKTSELEQKLSELSEADKRKREEELAAKGEFEQLKAQWEKEKQELQAKLEQYQGTVQTYEERTKTELETLLKDREDADEIRAELDGLPLVKQLSLAKRLTAAAGQQQSPPPSGGQPANRGTDVPTDIAAVMNDPEFVEYCNTMGITDPERRKTIAGKYALIKASKEVV